MKNSVLVTQHPTPGTHLLLFRGDIITFTLSLSCKEKGCAWLRTNIGRDWFDIPMTRVDEQRFKVVLPLCEIGHFQAKCMFLSEGESDPIWADGSNTIVNVEPSDTCCANIIYNAFVL